MLYKMKMEEGRSCVRAEGRGARRKPGGVRL